MAGEEKMRKEEGNYVDDNVIYLSRDYVEAEPGLSFEEIHPRVKENILNILEGGNGTIKIKIHREGFSLVKKFLQWGNKRHTQLFAEEIIKTGNLIDLRLRGLPLERQVALLDSSLANDTLDYVSHVATGFFEVYEGLDTLPFQAFAHELLHPREMERYRYNIEDHEFQGGEPVSRLNWGIALVVNRRWLADHNIERYRCAKAKYEQQLKGKVFSHFEGYLDHIETRIVSNPLYLYMLEQEKKK